MHIVLVHKHQQTHIKTHTHTHIVLKACGLVERGQCCQMRSQAVGRSQFLLANKKDDSQSVDCVMPAGVTNEVNAVL